MIPPKNQDLFQGGLKPPTRPSNYSRVPYAPSKRLFDEVIPGCWAEEVGFQGGDLTEKGPAPVWTKKHVGRFVCFIFATGEWISNCGFEMLEKRPQISLFLWANADIIYSTVKQSARRLSCYPTRPGKALQTNPRNPVPTSKPHVQYILLPTYARSRRAKTCSEAARSRRSPPCRGEEIVALDGAPVASMTPETFKAALQQRPLRLRPASSTGTVTHRWGAVPGSVSWRGRWMGGNHTVWLRGFGGRVVRWRCWRCGWRDADSRYWRGKNRHGKTGYSGGR